MLTLNGRLDEVLIEASAQLDDSIRGVVAASGVVARGRGDRVFFLPAPGSRCVPAPSAQHQGRGETGRMRRRDVVRTGEDGHPPATVEASELETTWQGLQDVLKKHVKKEQFETWFRRAALKSVDADTVVLAVQNTFARDWLKGNYEAELERAAAEVFDGKRAVEVVVDPELVVTERPAAKEAQAAAPVEPPPAVPAPQPPPPPPVGSGLLWASDVVLNPHYRFDSFVVGPCNRFAHAAAVGVSESPGTAYNPFFLHGSVGLGKTHLLQSLCTSMLERIPRSVEGRQVRVPGRHRRAHRRAVGAPAVRDRSRPLHPAGVGFGVVARDRRDPARPRVDPAQARPTRVTDSDAQDRANLATAAQPRCDAARTGRMDARFRLGGPNWIDTSAERPTRL